MNLIDHIHSKCDRTQKLVYRTADGAICEVSVVRKGDGKDILVVPTQTSCNMGCTFCHLTGLGIDAKNLTSNDIVALVQRTLDVVKRTEIQLLVSYMGAGEPLMNIDGVIESAVALRGAFGTDVRFGVATLIPSVSRFMRFHNAVVDHGLPMKLHWSLHHVDEKQRKSLMPAALHQDYAVQLVRNYARIRHVEVHYTLIDGVNDSHENAETLVHLLNDPRISVKLLRFAPRPESPLRESDNVLTFATHLRSYGHVVEEYCPPGRDIGSSCGQFIASRYLGR